MRCPRAASLAILLAGVGSVFALAPKVHADEKTIVVTQFDGTTLRGVLMENVPYDHLTLRLATGELRAVRWSSIEWVGECGPTGPPPPWALPQGTTFVSGLGTVSSKDDVHWPKPDRSPSPNAGTHLHVGLEAGAGTPVGYAGVVAAFDPVKWIELEGGIGAGGTFGPGLAGMLRGEVPLVKNARLGFGLGYSENFLSASKRAPDGEYPTAPGTSRWLNVEILSIDATERSGTMFRLFGGFAFLLNRGAYADVCPPGAADDHSANYDPDCSPPTFIQTPKSFSHAFPLKLIGYVGFEVLWRLA